MTTIPEASDVYYKAHNIHSKAEEMLENPELWVGCE
jgi:hypothetical protein